MKMSLTDYLQLNELKIFKNFNENLKHTITKTENVLTVKDGMLFTWDFENRCVLTLNLKAARSREGDNVSHQNLLSLSPVLFEPELILVNDSGTLLIVAGQCGVLVMELPTRYPPYGGFDHNKEIVYCRSYSLEERLLACNDIVQVQQVRFHPGSLTDSHILLLTSDNILRLYNIEKSTVVTLGVYPIGEKPMGNFPGTKKSLLSTLGDVAVDFVIGQSEILDDTDKLLKNTIDHSNLAWPVYILMGDGRVFYIHIPINNTLVKAILKGPLPSNYPNGDLNIESCSLLIINTNPEILIIGNSNGCIYHTIILPITIENNEKLLNKIDLKHLPKKELLCFEMIELELGIVLTTLDDNKKYTCPLFLHKDESKFNRYFITHTAGLHGITIECAENLQKFVNSDSGNENESIEDIFLSDSTIEYLLCTKMTTTDEKLNPIIGFSLYYEPVSVMAILSNGNVISLNLLTTIIKESETIINNISIKDENKLGLKNIIKERFDEYIEKLLKKSYNNKQPIIKLNKKNCYTQKECYELLQKSIQSIHETYFENLLKIREEILKRVKTLKLMKEYQLNELENLNNEKIKLQDKCELLAEKYEDLKDKQNIIIKRCETLLVLVIQKKFQQSDAEKNFLNELCLTKDKVELYKNSIEKLKMKVKYQKIQMDNWKAQETRKISCFSENHEKTIKNNLKDMSQKIAGMIQQINDFKQKLNIK